MSNLVLGPLADAVAQLWQGAQRGAAKGQPGCSSHGLCLWELAGLQSLQPLLPLAPTLPCGPSQEGLGQ